MDVEDFETEPTKKNAKGFIVLIILSILFILLFSFQNSTKVSNLFRKTVTQVVSLPEGFPDIPVYPNANLTSYYDEELEGEIEYQFKASWESKDSVPMIMEWYQNLKDESWVVVTKTSDPGATGAQDAVFESGNWRVYIIVQKRDVGDPTYIYVGLDPK